MGRGARFQVELSARDRLQLAELLRGGLQSVRAVLRAVAKHGTTVDSFVLAVIRKRSFLCVCREGFGSLA
ncbi:MAG: hypothetical protein ACYCSP_09665 [Acidobacteriaceae bacterium]